MPIRIKKLTTVQALQLQSLLHRKDILELQLSNIRQQIQLTIRSYGFDPTKDVQLLNDGSLQEKIIDTPVQGGKTK